MVKYGGVADTVIGWSLGQAADPVIMAHQVVLSSRLVRRGLRVVVLGVLLFFMLLGLALWIRPPGGNKRTMTGSA